MKIHLATMTLAATALGFSVLAVNAQPVQPSPGSGAPLQQQEGSDTGGPWGRMSPEDHAVFVDARVAGRLAEMKVVLKLTPDQEKLWPALESAIRDSVKLHVTQAQKAADQRKAATGKAPDPIQRLTFAADVAAQRSDALKKILSAAQPLYASLSEDQKKRLAVAHGSSDFSLDHEHYGIGAGDDEGRRAGMRRHWERGSGEDDGDHRGDRMNRHWGRDQGDDEDNRQDGSRRSR